MTTRFEWDEEKNRENQEKHGVSFELAQYAFLDPHRIIAEDLKHSQKEKRYYCFGQVGGGVLTVLPIVVKSFVSLVLDIGEEGSKFMKRKMQRDIKYTDEPLGTLRVVRDFLPSPEDLVLKEEAGEEFVQQYDLAAEIHTETLPQVTPPYGPLPCSGVGQSQRRITFAGVFVGMPSSMKILLLN